MIHTVKDFGVVNTAEADVFLELSCFFYDPMDRGAWQATVHGVRHDLVTKQQHQV